MNWKVFYTRREYEIQEKKLRKAMLLLQTIVKQSTDPAIKEMFNRAIKEINDIR